MDSTNRPVPIGTAKPLIAVTGLRQFTYLASHGLRSPLTAINWACGRLKKARQHSPEEEKCLQQIYANTKRLSHLLHAIFLVSSLHDRQYSVRSELQPLRSMMIDAFPEEENTTQVTITCDDSIHLPADTDILHTLLLSIFMACFSAQGNEDVKPINVHVDAEPDARVRITYRIRGDLQLLRTVKKHELVPSPESGGVVGGTTGLLLALSRDLAIASDGQLKLDAAEEEAVTITLTLPSAQH